MLTGKKKSTFFQSVNPNLYDYNSIFLRITVGLIKSIEKN